MSASDIRDKYQAVVSGTLPVSSFTSFDIERIQRYLGEDELRVVRALQSQTGISPGSFESRASVDAFGRQRVSNAQALFANKQLFADESYIWDNQAVSGAGTNSVYSADRASTTLSVSDATAGRRVRQTFQRFNYQSGKAQEIFITGVLQASGGGAGITRRLGYFGDDNGLFFGDLEGVAHTGLRSSVTGAPVDTVVPQSSWNLDKMDGTGPSGITADFTKAQIFIFEFEWLGVGSAWAGLVIDGVKHYVHRFDAANTIASVYSSSPNQPIRYEIENDGTGGAASIECICAHVSSDGGSDGLGDDRYFSTGSTLINANTAGVIYAIVGIRLRASHLGTVIRPEKVTMISSTATDFEWLLIYKPTVAAAISFTGLTGSAVEAGPGNAGNPSTSTLTNGRIVDGGFVRNTTQGGTTETRSINVTRTIGASIAGVQEELYLAVRPVDGNADIYGGIQWRELS